MPEQSKKREIIARVEALLGEEVPEDVEVDWDTIEMIFDELGEIALEDIVTSIRGQIYSVDVEETDTD